MLEKKQIGQSTQSIWSGEQEHEPYERSTQVPVVHSVSLATKILRLGIKSHLKRLKVTSIRETPTQLFELLRTKSKSLNLLRLQRVLHLAWLQLVTL